MTVTRAKTALLLAIVVAGCGGGSDSPERGAAEASPPAATSAAIAQPRIVDRPIPYGAKRRREMAAYSRRHYGTSAWRLTNPHVIVEHYTATNSFSSAYNTFARDTPDVELHELPGVCSHFIVDRDGTIYRLVPVTIRCRHTVGLNYTAIGIEHVGTSDQQVMGDRRQLQASLRLTRWLRCTQGIKVRDVIGHNESLSSPYHHERVASLRSQTHGDMKRATMTRYRSLLAARGC
jgi:beta-N-acetylhexosaminidase